MVMNYPFVKKIMIVSILSMYQTFRTLLTLIYNFADFVIDIINPLGCEYKDSEGIKKVYEYFFKANIFKCCVWKFIIIAIWILDRRRSVKISQKFQHKGECNMKHFLPKNKYSFALKGWRNNWITPQIYDILQKQ